ncbi:GyrI-like domain-containing protein [Elizabethkingia meningoseptica]|uniref:GyrI-like domain-containing protein n=1 Tax=Elizabethkingia meningoseptica TaxID=238 RepID=UPI0022F16321|nr:effector binding domain-containing protein [Elizabethkingia meningoseptica]EJK5327324.1 effector binding domain-containing protein [Elizabethkingia meningoseptica]MDE5466959.1 GyrI-like domain-containing protein [Elizabethkingia meningoseptica]MDE5473811.1 GyrI-like domain-containing protein [Elizabethkingia meningoseptica]MDE5477244.1 GyrI-like domain-containing protein [Elizabethkingia meningoseptica]MDE5484278.1 GyrI-like domain-containing protein [Elizabethkingia meningoseptica]
MDHHNIEAFYIIGIFIRTTNENGQSAQDIPALWTKFMSENIADQIPDKADSSVYCIYTDYEKDYTRPYTTILGRRVNSLDHIPEGMIGKAIAKGIYSKQTAIGNIAGGSVYNEWLKIWNSDLDRAYTADFEIYGDKAQNPENAEVDVYVAIK